MTNKEKYTLEYIAKEDLIIFEALAGSHAYGTATKDSDEDFRGIFIMKQEDIYSMEYVEQVNDPLNDIVYYEIGRFFELIAKSNPNILEIAGWMPKDCVTKRHDIYEIIEERKWDFLSKKCKDTFYGYGKSQISKALGMEKMMNWEEQRVARKYPIDFCYTIIGNGTMSLKKWLKKEEMDQKLCGIVKIPNARDMYALYYDNIAHLCFSRYISEDERENNKKSLKEKGLVVGVGYKGIQKEDDEGNVISNDLRSSSIPKEHNDNVFCHFSYNKDGFIAHCRDYKNYQEWLQKRNKQRWVDVKNHGQKIKNQSIDGKNLLHCTRLIEMAAEIADGKGVLVRRENASHLLDIRKGKYNLEEILSKSKIMLEEIDGKFKNSDLPDDVNIEKLNNILVKIRKEFYKNSNS